MQEQSQATSGEMWAPDISGESDKGLWKVNLSEWKHLKSAKPLSLGTKK